VFADLLLLLVLIVAVVALAWLLIRAQRIRSIPRRVLGSIPLALLALVLLAGTVLVGRGIYLVYVPRNTPVPNVKAEVTPERVARGQQLATAVCAACHGQNGQPPLSGGFDLASDIPLPVGHFYAANLTPAGQVASWSDGEILRAMREGISREGRVLAGMPAGNLRNMSDEDALSIIAFLRSQAPAGGLTPASQSSPLGLLMVGAGMFPLGAPPQSGVVTAPPMEPSATYGKYVVSYSDCKDCHGANLKGGTGPGPIGPNLLLVKDWKREDFVKAMRTGVDPYGRQIQPPMPWKQIGALGDTELAAVYEYLVSLGS
jgi:mono/diheme cytochrome c family protein